MALFNYECDEVKQIIDEVSPNYPQLTTFEKEWLFFHKYHYIPGVPVELECQEVIVKPTGTIQNAIPYPYKRAILKGQTLINHINKNDFINPSALLYTNDISVEKNTIYTCFAVLNRNDTISELTSTNKLVFRVKANNINGKDFIHKTIQPTDQTTVIHINTRIEIADEEKLHFRVYNAYPKNLKIMLIKGDYTSQTIPYFEGMQTTKTPVLKTVGKNLFDGEWEQGGIDQTTGKLFDSTSHRCKNKIPVVPLSQIVSNANLNLLFYDENDLFVGYKFQGQGITMQVPEGAVYMRFYRGAKLDDLQVEADTVATTYEPYKSNILSTPEDLELSGIGEVQDELNLLTGELTQKITEERLTNKGWAVDSVNPNNVNIGFYLTHSNSKANGAILSEQYPTLTSEQWKNKSVCGIYKGTKSIGFVIARSSLTEQNETGFMKWLTQNPLTIKYELATPNVKTVALTKLNKPYEGTNTYHLSPNTPCEAILEVPVVSTGEQTLQEINNY